MAYFFGTPRIGPTRMRTRQTTF